MQPSMRTLRCCFLVLGLAACAHTPTEAEYDRGSADSRQFARDAAGCEMEGQRAAGSYNTSGMIAEHNSYARMYDACMRAHGYPRKTP